MEARIANILSATEDAIVSMKHDLVAKMVRLPKAVRAPFQIQSPVTAARAARTLNRCPCTADEGDAT